MTIVAHGTRHVYTGATRHSIGENQAVTSNFFDELHPHLRNRPAIALTGANLIYDYLLHRPERTLAEISNRTGHAPKHVRNLMEKEPGRFTCARGRWSAIEQPIETEPRRQTLPVRVAAYLAEHGPATAPEISTALDARGNAVFEALSRGIPNAVIVGKKGVGRQKSNLWAMIK